MCDAAAIHIINDTSTTIQVYPMLSNSKDSNLYYVNPGDKLHGTDEPNNNINIVSVFVEYPDGQIKRHMVKYNKSDTKDPEFSKETQVSGPKLFYRYTTKIGLCDYKGIKTLVIKIMGA
jgi:hypothetical protein